MVQRKARSVVISSLATVLTMSVVGLTAVNQASAQSKIQLSFWTYPVFENVPGVKSPNYGDWEKAMALKYEKLHPNVQISVEVNPYTTGPDKVAAAIAAGNPPTVLEDGNIRLIPYAQQGELVPLNSILGNPKQYVPSYLSALTYKKKIYGVPVTGDPILMLANKAIFQKDGAANFLTANHQWTFAQFWSAMKKVSGHGVYGTEFEAANDQSDYFNEAFMWGEGATYLNGNNTGVAINSPAGVKGLQFMVNIQKHGYAAPGPSSLTPQEGNNLFLQSKVAVMPGEAFLISQIEQAIKQGQSKGPINIYPMLFPHAPKVATHIYSNITAFMVFKQKNPQVQAAALNFVKFMNTAANDRALSLSSYTIPAYVSLAGTWRNNGGMNAITHLVDAHPAEDIGLAAPNWSEIRPYFFPAIQAALTNSQTPVQALDKFAQEANPMLK